MDFLYTMEEAKEELRKEFLYYLRQKVYGLLLIIISIAAPVLVEPGAILFSIIVSPLGIYLIFTKKRIIRERRSR